MSVKAFPQSAEISAKMPYETKFVTVKGSKMAYVEAGQGDPILFLHGNPTSKYLWRNIMPWLESQGRVIAPDLIGMGESDKPNIDYRYHEHYDYLTGFIDALGLTDNITLVIHDWGSGLGFNYAAQNPSRIKGIAFMEALVRTRKWSDFPADFRTGFRLMRTPGIGWLMVSVGNMFIKQMLPQAIVRELGETEKAVYNAPYPTVGSRKPLLQWPREVPIDGQPADVHAVIDNYSRWLQQTNIPKLFFYASPGAVVDDEIVAWVKDSFPNLKAYDMGPGIHFVQEDNPHFIGEKLAEWYGQLR
ncbi:MAG: haloalkane dehalogenase [Chloroflexota bacterium]